VPLVQQRLRPSALHHYQGSSECGAQKESHFLRKKKREEEEEGKLPDQLAKECHMLPYHRIVQQAIDELGAAHLNKEVASVSRGGEKLQIIHRTKALTPITFKPDRVFTLRDRSKVAFQVLASQAGKHREIEADILRAFLCIGISKLVFIVPSSSDMENVNRICDIIQDVLEALGAREDYNLSMTILIPKSVRNQKDVIAELDRPQITREIFRR